MGMLHGQFVTYTIRKELDRKGRNYVCQALDNCLLEDKVLHAGERGYGLIYRSKGRTWSKRVHVQCFNMFIDMLEARHVGRIELNRATGVYKRAGRPKNDIDPNLLKLRRKLTFMLGTDRRNLLLALTLENPTRIKSAAYLLAIRFRELGNPDLGIPYKVNLGEDLGLVLEKKLGSTRFKSRYGDHNNKLGFDKDFIPVTDPILVSRLLVEDFCPDRIEEIMIPAIMGPKKDSALDAQGRWMELESEYPDWDQDTIRVQLQKEGHDV